MSLALVHSLLSTLGASAQPDEGVPAIEAQLAFEGAACGTAARLQSLVRRRSRRIEFVSEAERRVRVDVEAPTGPSPWQATLTFDLPGEAPQQRQLEADACGELMNAIGFVIALTLDPPASASPGLGDPVESEPTPTGEPSAPGPGPRSPTAPRSAETRDVSLIAPGPPSSFETAGSLGVHAVLAHEIAPSPLFGGGLAYSHLWIDANSVWDPSFRLSAEFAAGGGFSVPGGEATFRHASGTLELCPTLVGDSSFALRPCAMATAGAVWVSGSRTLEAESHTRPWVVLGGSLLARGAVSSSLLLELGVGMGATLYRDTFQFDPTVLHDVGPLAARGTLGVALVLP